MWPTSDQWDKAWRSGGTVVTRVEVWRAGVRQTLPDGSTSLLVNGGTVSVDESSKVRRTLTLTVGNVDLDPISAADLLSPFGTDLHVWAGITFTDGTTEVAPVGVFRIAAPGRSGVLSELAITASDYSKVLADARFLSPWVTPSGSLVTDEIHRMATDAVPSVTFLNLSGSRARTSVLTFDKDRWDAITSLAQSIGCEPYFDPTGTLVVRAVPTVTTAPVWACTSNAADANMIDVATGLSGDTVYNAVIATGSASGAPPVAAIAYQRSGPLAWSATFRRPRFYASPVLTTVQQCQSAATAILTRSVAYSRTLSPQSVPNPALDVGDSITVTLPSGLSDIRVVTSLRIPLAPGVMPLTTRVAVDAGLTPYVSGLS